MSKIVQNKLNLFDTDGPTYDTDEMQALSLEEVLVPMISILDTQVKSTLANLRALTEVDESEMHILRLVNSMELLKMHFEFTVALLGSHSDEDVCRLKDKFALIKDDYDKVKSKADLTLVPAKYAVAMMHDKIIAELKKILKICFKKTRQGSVELVNKEHYIARIQVMTGRIELSRVSYPVVVTFPKDDIYSYERSHSMWQDLNKKAIFKEMVTKKQVHSTSRLFHFFVHLSHIINSNRIRNKSSPYTKAIVSLIFEILYYGFQSAKIETQALLYLLNPDVNEAFKAWNLHETPWVCRTLLLVAPSVAYDRRMFLPRLFPKITRATIQKEYEDGTINKISPIDPKDLVASDLGYDRCAIIEELFTETDDTDKIPVRILANDYLDFEGAGTSLFQYVTQKARRMIPFMSAPRDTEERAIIIHMHGGGFVSMTSATHRMYLTKWVNTLKLIHFSIDYRNAPENKYPAAVDDVWQAYLWITNYVTNILGIKYQKVILVGDSSGATLALSLVLRLIRAGIQPPNGCLLFYPALILDPSSASPSYFEALDDPLLPYSLLKLIVEAYLDKDCKAREDPFISPLVASDELLEKLPPLRLVTGSKDPLCDDNWRFLEKMRKLNKDVKMTVHAHLAHGYICHKLLKNYDGFLDEACGLINELIDTKP